MPQGAGGRQLAWRDPNFYRVRYSAARIDPVIATDQHAGCGRVDHRGRDLVDSDAKLSCERAVYVDVDGRIVERRRELNVAKLGHTFKRRLQFHRIRQQGVETFTPDRDFNRRGRTKVEDL